MKSAERIIYVPLGDKTHEDLERAASSEAWKLSRDILERENLKEFKISILSLQKHPRVNLIYYLKKGITAMGGYLVKIEKMKSPQRT